MRSTVRIDDDLMQALKEQAGQRGTSLSRTLNAVLRAGLTVANNPVSRPEFKQRTVSLGAPSFDINKALTYSSALEDEAILEKLAARK